MGMFTEVEEPVLRDFDSGLHKNIMITYFLSLLFILEKAKKQHISVS